MNAWTKKSHCTIENNSKYTMHLIIDGYGNKEKLQDMVLIYDLLDNFPAKIGMNKLMPPFILIHKIPKLEYSGISGFIIIAESHIGLHTFPYKNLVNIDIFSCKTFNSEQAINFFKKGLDLKDIRVKTIKRW